MDSWTVAKVLSFATSDFSKRGMERPRFEAEVLLAEVLGVKRLDLYTGFDRPLEESELARFRKAIVERRSSVPSAYITGRREFWSREFLVDSRVLIPRPETETLVQATLDRAPCAEGCRMLDLCTGSGCVALTLALERPNAAVDAVDISRDACDVAAANVSRFGLDGRVRILEGDLFAPIDDGALYDIITANPPYVVESEIDRLEPEVRQEPRVALSGGPDGLDILRRIVLEAPDRLAHGGWLLVEIDPRQVDYLVEELGPRCFEEKGQVEPDLAGRARVVAWKKTKQP